MNYRTMKILFDKFPPRTRDVSREHAVVLL